MCGIYGVGDLSIRWPEKEIQKHALHIPIVWYNNFKAQNRKGKKVNNHHFILTRSNTENVLS